MQLITTYTGKQLDILNVQTSDIDIKDVAHSLSLQCRAMGHYDRFYSVAQHSYLLSMVVPEEMNLAALLHDASEAYTTDIPTPIKTTFPELMELDRSVQQAVIEHFDLNPQHLLDLKPYDRELFYRECQLLFTEFDCDWELTIPSVRELEINHLFEPQLAEQLFILRYEELTGIDL